MSFFKPRRLVQRQKLLAVQVAKDNYALSGGNRVEFERLVREDRRTKSIDPALIILFIRVAMAVFEYFQNRQVSGQPAAESDQEIYLEAIRFED